MGSEDFSDAEKARYARHFSLPQVGLEGQRRLKRASVLCVGAGGLGSPAAIYLAAAGVGRLGLVDADVVDASNLHRQILHGAGDVGRKKIDSALDRLREVNPHVEVEPHDTRLTSANARGIAEGYDVLVDGADNFPTRYLCNDLCWFLGIPNVHGSIFQFEGQVSVFAPKQGGPCYRCLYPTPPAPGMVPSCAEGGVLGVLPGIIGAMQAAEAIKLILGVGQPLIGHLLHFDVLSMRARRINLRRDPLCPLCGDSPTIHGLVDYEDFCGLRSREERLPEVNAQELAALLESPSPPLVIDVREDFERLLRSLPFSQHIRLGDLPKRLAELPRDRAIVLHCEQGMRSEQAARTLLRAGFAEVSHLRGGIQAWFDEKSGW